MPRLRANLVALVALLWIAAPLAADDEQSRFLRFTGDSRDGGVLETADVTYRNAKGVAVTLVSVVHIADSDYYRDLDESFDAYDAVLYEMVMPAGAAPPGRDDHLDGGIASLQRFLKDTLDLEFQLDAIDYRRDNFIHADLDAETFVRMQRERGESLITIFLNAMIRSLTDPKAYASYPDEPRDTFDLMTRPDGVRQLKLILARRLGDIEAEMAKLKLFDGTVLLIGRNQAAIAKLDEVLKQDKRRIAIFFGGAHMPDLDRRLRDRGFAPVQTLWRTAWDVTIRPDEPSAYQRLRQRADKHRTHDK